MKETDFFCLEGDKNVGEALRNKNIRIAEMYATQDWIDKARSKYAHLLSSINLRAVSEASLRRISNQKNPNGVLAVIEKNFAIAPRQSDWIVAIDDIQDPGNMGTIIRACDWFGVKMIMCGKRSVYKFNPKVVQSAMGSLLRVPVLYGDLEEWIATRKEPIVASSLDGEDLRSAQIPKKGILVLGNESQGISSAILQKCDLRVKIPSRDSQAESLNIAVACGILLSHIT